uniref:U34-Lycotoxin-Lsp1b_1 n=1 Tax=Lycosa sp. SGP-2016 TaxID=1905177 RepID=A0A482ZB98_9ARAC
MKFAIILLFSLVVFVLASGSVEDNTREDFPEQQRACAGSREPCTRGDDCSCCGDRTKCDCNWPGRPGCYCMTAMFLTGIKKLFECRIG